MVLFILFGNNDDDMLDADGNSEKNTWSCVHKSTYLGIVW